jgi:hypothetical protein
MLETLFISGLIVLPLGVAVILILYRARFFVVGIIGIVAILMLIWAGLRFAAMFDEVPEGEQSVQGGSTALLDQAGDSGLPSIDVRLARA